MNESQITSYWPTLWTLVGTVLAAGITALTAAGVKLPVITTDRAVVIALAVIGFVMCATGGSGRAIGEYGITHPISIMGAVFGIAALLLAASALFGFTLPLISSDRVAVYVMAGIILLKLVINGVFYFVTR